MPVVTNKTADRTEAVFSAISLILPGCTILILKPSIANHYREYIDIQ